MTVLAAVRHRLARSPWIYWAVIGALALLAGVAVAGATSGVEAARRAWGDTTEVYVATADVDPGEGLAERVERRDLPAPMVPGAAVDTVERTAIARQHIAAGEIVVAADVAAEGTPQSLIPSGWSAVAVAERVPSGVVTGDLVRVASGGVVLADDGVVVSATAESVLVAVPAGAAAQVAQAATAGDVSLLVEP